MSNEIKTPKTEFAARLRLAMQKTKLDSEKLANKVGVDLVDFIEYIDAKKEPSAAIKLKIAKELNVDQDWFIDGTSIDLKLALFHGEEIDDKKWNKIESYALLLKKYENEQNK